MRHPPRRALAQLGSAAGAGDGRAGGGHTLAADRAVGLALSLELAPGPVEALLEREPTDLDRRERKRGSQSRHQPLLQTPTTRPSSSSSRVRIGSIWSFSGWSRTWSFSL